jgi:hypothetical protein
MVEEHCPVFCDASTAVSITDAFWDFEPRLITIMQNNVINLREYILNPFDDVAPHFKHAWMTAANINRI